MTAPVTVVIPLFDKQDTIAAAIRSVLDQTHRDLALVVVDDGSRDAGPALAESIEDPRLSVIRQANAGPGAARNRGAAATASPLLAFLDADDEWDADFLETGLAGLASHPQAAAHVSLYREGRSAATRRTEAQELGIADGPFVARADMSGDRLKAATDLLHTSCIVCRRMAFETYGGFYDRARCLYGEDSYLWLQILLNETVLFGLEPKAWFHTEHSALGAARLGRHPLRPALSDPEPLRARVRPERRVLLERLLAFYRLLETEKARSVEAPGLARLRSLRAAFPWPDPPPLRLRLREARQSIRALVEPLRGQ